jgi:gamma-glutamyltranspeptidase / glutathione hydrolase / leukotriene-C4 hydrolase
MEHVYRSVVEDDTTQNATAYGGRWNTLRVPPGDSGTSHLSVVDGAGGAVAFTTTINTPFGSLVMSESTGAAEPSR